MRHVEVESVLVLKRHDDQRIAPGIADAKPLPIHKQPDLIGTRARSARVGCSGRRTENERDQPHRSHSPVRRERRNGAALDAEDAERAASQQHEQAERD